MNFLAHYFLDRQRPESEFAIGAATPDLMSIYNASLRIKYASFKKLDRSQFEGSELDFYEGVSRHFEADKNFHSSDFFLEQTTILIRMLKNEMEGEIVPRKYFVAHVLLELLLDKVIIEDHPDIIFEYYAHYDAVDPLDIQAYTEKICGRPLPRYDAFLVKFRENRYLMKYVEKAHIVFVLTRILQRVDIKEEEFTQKEVFIRLISRFEEQLRSSYQAYFDQLSAQIA